MTSVRYTTRSKYLPELERWLLQIENTLRTGEAHSTVLEPRTGFVRQAIRLHILREEHEVFRSDWPYKCDTFPARIKALATALRNSNLYGIYQSSHHDGTLELQLIGEAPESLHVLHQ